MPRLLFFQIGVFVSALLLFSVQLITARQLLSLFGGSVMMWGTCMIFFQGLLLGGYAFAHWGLQRLGVKRYTKLHWILMLAGGICYPLQRLTVDWQGLPPTGALLLLLTIKTSICYFALSTVSVVLQRWLSASPLKEKQNPYILYSPSNLGSILALLSYPLVVEPLLTLDAQIQVWWGGYSLLLLILIPCTPRRVKEVRKPEKRELGPKEGSPLRWLGLSACGSALLLSTTNIITFDIASTPLLWVLPLALYLLTFVLVFKSRSWFPDWLITLAYWTLPLALLICWFSELHIVLPSLVFMVVLYLAILFVLCMCCHGLLHRERPKDPRQLTRFYLYLSLGGVSGSIIINWLIPFVSDRSIEYPLALLLTAWLLSYKRLSVFNKRALVHAVIYLLLVLLAFSVIGRVNLEPYAAFLAVGLLIMLPLILVRNSLVHFRWFFSAAMVALLASPYLISDNTYLLFHRNFYGIYRIFDQDGQRHLMHGTTRHGTQYLNDSEKRHLPLAYYHPTTGSGELLQGNPLQVENIGMIGLGSGALGAYLKEGQRMTVYELDADNIEIAETYFSFLDHGRNNGAQFEFVVGDGRLALKSVEDNTYDLLIVDAFSSDSIPVHLLTVEAFQDYLRVLSPEGILLIHCSNRYLDILGLIQANADKMETSLLHKENEGLDNGDALASDWVVLSNSEKTLTRLQEEFAWKPYRSPSPLPRPWTDQFSSILDMFQ